MKKSLILTAVLAMGLIFSGQVMAEEISIVGTGSGAAVLKAVGAAFTQKNSEITINVPKSIGSGGGIKAVGSDNNLIGRVARGLNKDKEKAYGLSYLPYAKNPIVFFVNKSVGITNLTTQQVCDIYSGKITNYKNVGGKDSKIRVIRREEGDSSLAILLKLFPGFADITLTPKSKISLSDPATCELAEKKAGTIAFGTYANAKNYNVDILIIEDKNASSAEYPYIGVLALIFKEKNKIGNIKKFLEFATSENAHDAIKEAGAIPY